jgi:hypothetical protein
MPFSMNCTNKGCGKMQEPYLDKKTDKVFCSECDKEITNVSYFAKVQMRSLNQYKIKKNDSFSVKCDKCNYMGRPLLEQDDIVCSSCKKSLDKLSMTFKNMLKEKLKELAKEDV